VSTILQRENVPSDKPIIAVQPFSLWHYKEWPTDNYVKLINWIRTSFSPPIIIIGTADERPRAADIIKRCGPGVHNLAGKTSLGELAALLMACSLLIGGDSAGIHIAAAVGTPTISLFGPSSPVSWAPRGKQHEVIHKNWACVPCREKGCQNSERSRCLEELTFDEVRAGVEKQIRDLLL
jgi:heptosyltransferase-3